MAVHLDPELPIHPLTVDDFLAMARAGILPEDVGVELIDGVLVKQESPSPEHSDAIMYLTMLAVPVAAKHGLLVRPQLPLDVRSEISLPQPDLAIVEEFPDARFPEALLAIEVSHTSRRIDLGRKATIYAEAEIPEYWVLDVDRRLLIVHTAPAGGEYRSIVIHDEHARVTAGRPPLSVTVAELMR